MNKSLTTLPWHWLPPLITLSLVLALHIDVPYYDQWDLLPLLHAYYQGTLHVQDLLLPHNGHILLFPKIVMLGLAILTQWNTLAEVLFSFFCMLVNWFLLQTMAGKLLERTLSIAEKTVISLLVFSLSQAQNWLWGWQLQIPLALLFILSGICSLLYIRNNLAALIVTAACGTAATFSFAGSLPFWIAVMPMFWQRQRLLLLPWLFISSICILTYANLVGLLQNSSATPYLLDPMEILRHAKNTLAALGNLVARFHMVSATTAGVVALSIIGLQYANFPSKQKSLALTLLLFTAGSALLVSLSRSGLGDEQMLASRYGTLTLPLWTSTAMLLMAKTHAQQRMRNSVGFLLLISLLISDVYSIQEFRQLHKRLQRGSVSLAQIDNTELEKQIGVINPRKNREQALQEARQLRQYHLSFYRQSEP